MRTARSPESTVAEHRPPGAPARETKELGEIAHRWRDELAQLLAKIEAEALALNANDVENTVGHRAHGEKQGEHRALRQRGALSAFTCQVTPDFTRPRPEIFLRELPFGLCGLCDEIDLRDIG